MSTILIDGWMPVYFAFTDDMYNVQISGVCAFLGTTQDVQDYATASGMSGTYLGQIPKKELKRFRPALKKAISDERRNMRQLGHSARVVVTVTLGGDAFLPGAGQALRDAHEGKDPSRSESCGYGVNILAAGVLIGADAND